MQIRKAGESDREAIYDTHIASVKAVESTEYSEQDLAVLVKHISPDMYCFENPNSDFLVVEQDSEIVGFVEALMAESEIDKLYVHPQ